MKNSYFIVISILIIIYIVASVKKNKLSIKESFFWVLASLIMLFLSIFPYSINTLAKLFGIDYPPSLFFAFCIIFLALINFKNSKRIAEQKEEIIELAQVVAILKSERGNNDKEK